MGINYETIETFSSEADDVSKKLVDFYNDHLVADEGVEGLVGLIEELSRDTGEQYLE